MESQPLRLECATCGGADEATAAAVQRGYQRCRYCGHLTGFAPLDTEAFEGPGRGVVVRSGHRWRVLLPRGLGVGTADVLAGGGVIALLALVLLTPLEAWWLEHGPADATALYLARLVAAAVSVALVGWLILERVSRPELTCGGSELTALRSPGRRGLSRIALQPGARVRRHRGRVLVRSGRQRLVVEADSAARWLAGVLETILHRALRPGEGPPACPGCGAALANWDELQQTGFTNCTYCRTGWVLAGERMERAPVRLPAPQRNPEPPHRYVRVTRGGEVRLRVAPLGIPLEVPELLVSLGSLILLPIGLGAALVAIVAIRDDAPVVARLMLGTLGLLLLALGVGVGVVMGSPREARLGRALLRFELRFSGLALAARRVSLMRLEALRFRGEPGAWSALVVQTPGDTTELEFYVPDAAEDRWLRSVLIEEVAERMGALGRRVERAPQQKRGVSDRPATAGEASESES